MGFGGEVVGGSKPAVAMVGVELVFSALQIFIKLALDNGMDERVLVAYRIMFASAFLCPLAFFIDQSAKTIHHGKALGAVLIVAGLYMVLCKAREAQEKAAGVLPGDEELGKESAADAGKMPIVKQNDGT